MASAADIVAGMLSSAWAQATQATSKAQSLLSGAESKLANVDKVGSPPDIPMPEIPKVVPLNPVTEATITNPMNTVVKDLESKMVGGFTDFIAKNFPYDVITGAQEWVDNELKNGGSGINVDIERHLWERARGNILSDAARAEDELMLTFASRRFPVPPGALTYGVMNLRRTAQASIGTAASTQAVESFKAELENVRFAVDKAISLRELALKSVKDYLDLVVAEPTRLGVQAGTAIADMLSRFATLSAEYYKLQLTAIDYPIKLKTANLERKIHNEELNAENKLKAAIKQAETAMAGAQSMGTLAAAAVNALHGQASISGSDITNFDGGSL